MRRSKKCLELRAATARSLAKVEAAVARGDVTTALNVVSVATNVADATLRATAVSNTNYNGSPLLRQVDETIFEPQVVAIVYPVQNLFQNVSAQRAQFEQMDRQRKNDLDDTMIALGNMFSEPSSTKKLQRITNRDKSNFSLKGAENTQIKFLKENGKSLAIKKNKIQLDEKDVRGNLADFSDTLQTLEEATAPPQPVREDIFTFKNDKCGERFFKLRTESHNSNECWKYESSRYEDDDDHEANATTPLNEQNLPCAIRGALDTVEGWEQENTGTSLHTYDYQNDYLGFYDDYQHQVFNNSRPDVQTVDSIFNADQSPHPNSEETFPSIPVASKYSQYPVLLYRMDSKCYAFQRKKCKGKFDIYECISCKTSERKTTAVKVYNNNFLKNPQQLLHVCEMRDFAQEAGERTLYNTLKKIRESDKVSLPLTEFRSMLSDVSTDPNLDVEEKHAINTKFSNFSKMKKTFWRATASLKNSATRMDNVEHKYWTSLIPTDIGQLPYTFIQVHKKDELVLFTDAVTRLACSIGINKFIADGTHNCKPKELGRAGQFYTIHAALKSGHSVPVLQAFVNGHTKKIYKNLFGHLKQHLATIDPSSVSSQYTFVLDFEHAAISAIHETFNNPSVEGCAFHFAQALNRKRDKILGKYSSDPIILQWFNRIQALVFLPTSLHVRSGLFEVPVPADHKGHNACKTFLEYFAETWGPEGMFAGMWHKFAMINLRTTNLAESYHSVLERSLARTVQQPLLGDVLSYLQGAQLQSYYELTRVLKNQEIHQLGDEDRIRQSQVQDKMNEFREREMTQPGGPCQAALLGYLDTMVRHCTTKKV